MMCRAARVPLLVLLVTLSGAGAAAPPKETKVSGTYGTYAIDRAEGLRMAAQFAALDTFPIRLSALEKIVGRPLGGHFTSESKSAGFEHDGRGPIGPNVGGMPIDHGAKDAPMLLELRSQYYPRYDDDRRFRERPPRASDDPLIDRIELSDRYSSGPPPQIDGVERFDNLLYVDSGEFWLAKPVPVGPLRKHQGFLVITERDATLRSPDERWRFKVSVERGPYYNQAEVQLGLAPLLELIKAVNSSSKSKTAFAEFFDGWKSKYAAQAELGSYHFGLVSHNPRYFSVAFTDGPYKGDFLRQERRSASLYIDTYVNTDAASEARVPVPALFAALGMQRAKVTEDVPTRAAFHKGDNAIVYYNRVVVEAGKWRVSMSGFYALQNGKVATDIDLATFLPRSINVTWHEPAR